MIISFGFLLALASKLAIGLGGAAGVTKGVNWFNKKNFNSSKKAGAFHADSEHEAEKS
jgi:hypothetical protein